MENTAKKKRRRPGLGAVTAVILLLLFALLRVTHVIIYAGYRYTTCFAEDFTAPEGRLITERTVSELRYMKHLRSLGLYDTHIENADFLADLPELWILYLNSTFEPAQYPVKKIPSLRNSPDLICINMWIDTENLDFIADNPALTDLHISAQNTEIKDISGLKNKPELHFLSLYNVNCEDLSVLLELPSLDYLYLYGTIIPDEIKDKLTERGVEVYNMTMEEYNKQ